MTVRLGLLVPFGRCAPDVAFHISFVNTLAYLQEQNIEAVFVHQAGDSNIGHAREALMWRAYHTQPEITHFLYIDDDIGWTPNHIASLLASDHEFCAAIYPKKADKLDFPIYPPPGAPIFHPRTGFAEMLHIGFGFTMLKREVIDALIEANQNLHYTEEGKDCWGLFMDALTLREDGTSIRMSEDVAFCHRWLRIGGKIWADPDANLVHVGRKEYSGNLREVMVTGA